MVCCLVFTDDCPEDISCYLSLEIETVCRERLPCICGGGRWGVGGGGGGGRGTILSSHSVTVFALLPVSCRRQNRTRSKVWSFILVTISQSKC